MPDTPKLLDLTGAKILYDDLRERLENQSEQIDALESSNAEHANVHMGLFRDAQGYLCEI